MTVDYKQVFASYMRARELLKRAPFDPKAQQFALAQVAECAAILRVFLGPQAPPLPVVGTPTHEAFNDYWKWLSATPGKN